MGSQSKKWKVDWDSRIIYLSKTITNKELVGLFAYLTGEAMERMAEDGPDAEWTFVTSESN